MTCIDCRHYHEIEASGFDEGRIFPGRGECWYNPPVSLMDPAGRVITARPEVLGIETCANYTSNLAWWWPIFDWFKVVRSRLKFDRHSETGRGVRSD